MALPPLGPPASPPQATLGKIDRNAGLASGGSGNSRMSPAEERASQVEKDANRRVMIADRTVEDARRAADQRMDEIQDQFEKTETTKSDQHVDAMEKQKMRGYEQIRDLQRAQQAEMNRLKRDGERDVRTLQDHYRDTTSRVGHQGEEELKKIERRFSHEIESQSLNRAAETELSETSTRQQLEQTRASQEEKINSLSAQNRAEYERAVEGSLQARGQADAEFARQHAERLATHAETLNDIDSRASKAIREIRRDTSHKIAAYADRQDDPFYRLLDLDARVDERDDEYVLTARIPEHEQKHVSVSIKGNQLVLSGSRRNEEKLELEPGRTQGTNAFQSFLETFPISWPVDAKLLTREFEGDRLVVRVPKKTVDLAYKSPVKEQPARARVERPKFPDNLPIAKADAARESSEDPLVMPSQNGKSKGSGTLT